MSSPEGKYGQAPIPVTLGPLPTQPDPTPPELRVVKHLVGYTEVQLSNGDTIRLHLHVDHFAFDAAVASFLPSYRVLPEVIKHDWAGCAPLPGPLS